MRSLRKGVHVCLAFLCFSNCDGGNDEKRASTGDGKQKMALVRNELRTPKYASAFLFVRHLVLLAPASLSLSLFLSPAINPYRGSVNHSPPYTMKLIVRLIGLTMRLSIRVTLSFPSLFLLSLRIRARVVSPRKCSTRLTTIYSRKSFMSANYTVENSLSRENYI